MNQVDLLPGFADPVRDAASAFRVLLDVMARPGQVRDMPSPEAAPEGLSPALAAVVLGLMDADTPVWLDSDLVGSGARGYLGFHTGAPVVETLEAATFAILGPDKLVDAADRVSIGTPDYPDRSATLVVRVTGFDADKGATLTGPGIETTARLAPRGVSPDAWRALARNAALYPLGFDTIFAAEDAVACLPRSTAIRFEEE